MGLMTVRGYVGLLLFIPISLSLGADPLDQWHWRNPLPSANPLCEVTYGNGLFVAVGDGEAVMTSPDGIQWTTQHSGSGFRLQGIAYGQGTFVAVGTYHPQVEGFGRSDGEWHNACDPSIPGINVDVVNGTTCFGAIMTSTDGTNWTAQGLQLDTSGLDSVTYGDGLFVAVGTPQQLSDPTNTPSGILTSPDGVHWTPTGVFADGPLTGVAYGNGLFLVAGWDLGPSSWPGVLVTSTDGVHWSGPNPVSNQDFCGLCFGQGVFVGVGLGGITISTNGDTWTTVGPGVSLNSVGYGNGLFVAVGFQGQLLTSTDAVQWTSVASGTSQGLAGAAWGNGRFVVVGGGALLASDNGQAWTNLWSGIPGYALFDVAYGNGQFVAGASIDFGWSFDGFLTSTDGVNWARTSVADSNPLWRIVYDGGRFVAVGDSAVWSSTDGLSWSKVVSGSSRYLQDVCYTGDAYVAVGGSGILRGSADASKWVDYDLGTSNMIAVAYGNGLCVAATWDRNMLRSTNGVDWVYQSLTNLNLGDSDLKSMAFGNGVFVAVGDGIVIYSADAVNWNAIHLNAFLNRVCYGEGMFVAVDNYGQILSSVDGKLWAPHPSGTAICLYGIASGGGSFVAVGVEEAGILQSGNLHATPVQFLLTPPQFRPDGTIALAVNGLTGTNVQVQGSADLGKWQPITNLAVTGASMQIILPKPSGVDQWFYRAAQSQ